VCICSVYVCACMRVTHVRWCGLVYVCACMRVCVYASVNVCMCVCTMCEHCVTVCTVYSLADLSTFMVGRIGAWRPAVHRPPFALGASSSFVLCVCVRVHTYMRVYECPICLCVSGFLFAIGEAMQPMLMSTKCLRIEDPASSELLRSKALI